MRGPGSDIDWDRLPTGKSRMVCPHCGRGPKDKTVGVTVAYNDGIAHCFRCDYVERRNGVRREASRIRFRDAEMRHEILSDYWLTIWNSCEPICGVARDYLLSRNCIVPPQDGDVRCHHNLKHLSGYVGPAIVALVTDVHTRQPISLLRTWVTRDGKKATNPAKLLISGHRKKGGVIRIWPDDALTSGLGVAEGIETALSLAHAVTPVWALLDASNMSQFDALPGVESLTIAVDHDQHGKGQSAAAQCAALWRKAGSEVRLVMPPAVGTDLNDLGRRA